MICNHFFALHRRKRVAVLIHEALHSAGLSEAPHDTCGMTPNEITRMVEQACSL